MKLLFIFFFFKISVSGVFNKESYFLLKGKLVFIFEKSCV